MMCCQWKHRWSKWVVVALLLVAAPAAAELRVFACEPEWAALSAALGGDRVSVDMATTAATAAFSSDSALARLCS